MAPYINFLTLLFTMVGFFQGIEGTLYPMNKGCIFNLNLSENNLKANINADMGNPSKDQKTVQLTQDWVNKYNWVFLYNRTADWSESVNVDDSQLPEWMELTVTLQEALKKFFDPYQSDIPIYFCDFVKTARQCNLPSFEYMKC